MSRVMGYRGLYSGTLGIKGCRQGHERVEDHREPLALHQTAVTSVGDVRFFLTLLETLFSGGGFISHHVSRLCYGTCSVTRSWSAACLYTSFYVLVVCYHSFGTNPPPTKSAWPPPGLVTDALTSYALVAVCPAERDLHTLPAKITTHYCRAFLAKAACVCLSRLY